jgi:hypothetical protein
MLNNNLPSKGTLGIEKQPLKNATDKTFGVGVIFVGQ